MTYMRSENEPVVEEYPPEKIKRVRRFSRKAFLIFAPVHLYVGWSLLPDLPIEYHHQLFGALLLVVSGIIIPFGTLSAVYVKNQNAVDRLVWSGSLAMGLFSSLLVFTLFRDLVLLIPNLDPWTSQSATLVVVMAGILTLVGFFNARRVAKVVRVDISLENLPHDLNGFTIAQISDIHVGPTIKGDYVQAVVERVNAESPDVIAITGDVVDGKVGHLAKETQSLSQLKARYGAFVVTGNHEYYSGAEAWMQEFSRLGLQPLMNEHAVIEHNGESLVIAGVTDYSAANFDKTQASDPQAALLGSPQDTPKVLLAHQPRTAEAADKAGFDLQLSGHTHGGQFWPWNHFVKMQQPFTAGLNRLGDLLIYTSRGTGYWGPPKRFGVPSEITLIRLSDGKAR